MTSPEARPTDAKASREELAIDRILKVGAAILQVPTVSSPEAVAKVLDLLGKELACAVTYGHQRALRIASQYIVDAYATAIPDEDRAQIQVVDSALSAILLCGALALRFGDYEQAVALAQLSKFENGEGATSIIEQAGLIQRRFELSEPVRMALSKAGEQAEYRGGLPDQSPLLAASIVQFFALAHLLRRQGCLDSWPAFKQHAGKYSEPLFVTLIEDREARRRLLGETSDDRLRELISECQRLHNESIRGSSSWSLQSRTVERFMSKA